MAARQRKSSSSDGNAVGHGGDAIRSLGEQRPPFGRIRHPAGQGTSERQARFLARAQILVDVDRCRSTFLNAPNDERLTTTAIACSKDAIDAGGVFAGSRLDVGARILLDAQRLDGAFFRAQEAQSQENKLSGEDCATLSS